MKKKKMKKWKKKWKVEENWKNEDKWSKLNKRKIEENWKTEEIEKCDWIQNYKNIKIKIEKLDDTGRNLTKLKNQKNLRKMIESKMD